MKQNKKISLVEAMSIGIGGMVGGGIFAVLGLAASLAKGGTPIAFLFAGILAILTSYSYVKLSTTYPDRGGTVKFMNQGFGINLFSGGINNLLWVSYIIMLSLYSSAFGSYAPNLLSISSNHNVDFHFYASLVIVIATIINYYSVAIVGKIESVAVIIKLVILIAFVGLGFAGLSSNPNMVQLSPAHYENLITLFAGGMVIFVAYEGFELIANAAPDIINPQKNIARSYYYAVGFVILLYIAIAIVTVGSLPYKEIAIAKDYVLAAAARPMLGNAGFIIITIAALISTFSAINASIYGGSKVNFEIAEDKELPQHFLSLLWNKPIGLFITSAATLVLVNSLNLESISTAGSIGFLLIFAIVNYVCFRLHKEVKANRVIPFIAFILCSVAAIVLVHQQLTSNKLGVIVEVGIIAGCFVMEFVYRTFFKGK